MTHVADSTADLPAAPPKNCDGYDDLAMWKRKIDGIEFNIYASQKFIVYIDKDGDIDWSTTAEWDAQGPQNLKTHNRFISKAAQLETIPCAGLGKTTILHFKRLVGEGLVQSLKHDYQGAGICMEAASEFITRRNEEIARGWLLVASICATVPFVIGGVLLGIFRSNAILALGHLGFWASIGCAAGALGALLSIITRQGKLVVDCTAGKRLHQLEAASRILAGAISGIVASLAVRSGFALPALGKGALIAPTILLAAVAAGATERYIASLMKRIEHRPPSTQTKKVKNDE